MSAVSEKKDCIKYNLNVKNHWLLQFHLLSKHVPSLKFNPQLSSTDDNLNFLKKFTVLSFR